MRCIIDSFSAWGIFPYSVIVHARFKFVELVRKSKSDKTMSTFEIVQTAMKANDLVCLTKKNTDLLMKQLEASNMKSVVYLLM